MPFVCLTFQNKGLHILRLWYFGQMVLFQCWHGVQVFLLQPGVCGVAVEGWEDHMLSYVCVCYNAIIQFLSYQSSIISVWDGVRASTWFLVSRQRWRKYKVVIVSFIWCPHLTVEFERHLDRLISRLSIHLEFIYSSHGASDTASRLDRPAEGDLVSLLTFQFGVGERG